MKTINFELSKRLNDGGWLDNIDTYYIYDSKGIIRKSDIKGDCLFYIKTLTFEEAIEFIRNYFKNSKYDFNIKLLSDGYITEINHPFRIFMGETLLESLEKMLEYLLDNNLLTK